MGNSDIQQIAIPLILLLCILCIVFFLMGDNKQTKRRVARVTNRKMAGMGKAASVMSLKRKKNDTPLPFIGILIAKLPTQAAIKARLERAGMVITPDKYVLYCSLAAIAITGFMLINHKPKLFALMGGLILGFILPHLIVGSKGTKRLKKFLILFPDAIDFIVRGLRSGLPVTESMNIVGKEMQEPIASIFAHMGESVRLGVPFDKALQDTARKLHLTEFNFFVTSIILQRETGGNLSEILNNLSEVLRGRLMMRMKIKAMSSEAKASAIIVGSLPFIVISALQFVSPDYLDPLLDTTKGNFIALGCALSLVFGITVMIKMTKFEI